MNLTTLLFLTLAVLPSVLHADPAKADAPKLDEDLDPADYEKQIKDLLSQKLKGLNIETPDLKSATGNEIPGMKGDSKSPDQDDEDFSPGMQEEEEEDSQKDAAGGQPKIELEDPTVGVVDDLDTVKPSASYNFQAETDRLMDIIVNSLYTERDVFLRELVSNSADALEKVRVSQLQGTAKGKVDEEELKVLVKVDKFKGILSVVDNGIGMTKEELEKNLGTVAKSGTQQFMEAAKRGDSASNLIGQFGVGFYSAFLVADKVSVISKRADSKDWYLWQSSERAGFTIGKDTRKRAPSDFKHGTIVTLHLKEDANSTYTDKYKIKYILQRFSAFVPFPIYLGEVRSSSKTIDWVRTNGDKPLWLRDRKTITDDEYTDFYKNVTKVNLPPMGWTHFRAEGDLEFNGLFYLPARAGLEAAIPSAKSQVKLYVQRVLITDSLENFLPKYLSFMKGIVDSNDLPLKVDRENFSQMKVMRMMKHKAYTKIFELFHKIIKDGRSEKEELEAAVTDLKRTEAEMTEPAPPKTLVQMVEELSKDSFPKYRKFHSFWNAYGDHLLTGCMEQDISAKEKEKIVGLYHTYTTFGNKLLTSLSDYVERMIPGQDTIYFMTGDNIELMVKSPYIEFYVKHGIEVLLVVGPYDEQCLLSSTTFRGLHIVSIEMNQMVKPSDLAFAVVHHNLQQGLYKNDGKWNVESAEDVDQKQRQKMTKEVSQEMRIRQFALNSMFKPLINWFGKRLAGQFEGQIEITATLPISPARIAIPFNGFTAAHERLARTTISIDKKMLDEMSHRKNLDINAEHPLVHHLLKEILAIKESRKKEKRSAKEDAALVERERQVNHMVDMLYESALISCGFVSRRPYLLLEDFYRLIGVQHNLGVEAAKIDIPEEIMQKARVKVLGAGAAEGEGDDDADEVEADLPFDDDEYFNEKDEL